MQEKIFSNPSLFSEIAKYLDVESLIKVRQLSSQAKNLFAQDKISTYINAILHHSFTNINLPKIPQLSFQELCLLKGFVDHIVHCNNPVKTKIVNIDFPAPSTSFRKEGTYLEKNNLKKIAGNIAKNFKRLFREKKTQDSQLLTKFDLPRTVHLPIVSNWKKYEMEFIKHLNNQEFSEFLLATKELSSALDSNMLMIIFLLHPSLFNDKPSELLKKLYIEVFNLLNSVEETFEYEHFSNNLLSYHEKLFQHCRKMLSLNEEINTIDPSTIIKLYRYFRDSEGVTKVLDGNTLVRKEKILEIVDKSSESLIFSFTDTHNLVIWKR